MCSQIVHIIILLYGNLYVKIVLNTILIRLVLKLLVDYFYDIKIVQILYSTDHKLNGSSNDFMILLLKNFNSLSYIYVKNCKLDFD